MHKLVVFIILLCYCLRGNSQNLLDNPYRNNEIPLIYDVYTQYKWGTAFQPLQDGYVYKVGMFISTSDVSDHVVQIWINEGNQNSLFAGPFTWNSVPGSQGWAEFEFPYAIEIKANRNYIISIINSTDLNASSRKYFNSITLNTPVRNSRENSSYNQEIITSTDLHKNNSVRVAVALKFTPGSIGSDQTVCYNTVPASLTLLSAPSGGTGTYIYQWQFSIDNINWSDISGANDVRFAPTSLNVNTWYRCKVTCGKFGTEITNTVKITIIENLTAGSIGTDQAICTNTQPLILTQITAPTGGADDYVYQWQSSSDNVIWIDISGATSVDFSPPSLTANIWYRRKVTSGNCASVITNPIRITVYSNLVAGTIGTDQTICYNTQPDNLTQLTAPSGGSGTYSYQWQSSIDNIDWTNIDGATSVSYAVPPLISERWYRRNISSGSCAAASNAVHITVYPNLVAGTIGHDQTICYNTVPATLNQITGSSGGTGEYSYQWQSSLNNISWTDISNAYLSNYSPPALTSSIWYRQNITSGCTANSNSVRITLYPQVSSAQLHDNKTIYENTSTTFNISISGGDPPYTVSYSVNGNTQPSISNYTSGAEISTGVLTTGKYTYSLRSVTDSHGCQAQNLGTSISINVTSEQVIISNKALVIVNSASSYYSNYTTYIVPYLDNFGIPYDVCNINTTGLPSFNDYAVIIFGHKNVYSSGYPIDQLETAVYDGVGLYSFDSHLFDYPSEFNALITQRSVNSNVINISNTAHYITQYHNPDIYNPTNNIINLLRYWSLSQTSNLIGGIDLAQMSSGGQTISLLQAANYGSGKIVKWCGYDWVFENYLGPVYGMDDLIWRGIVWAARKPFAMQGVPPMVTMRVDDVEGNTGGATENFIWVQICNEFGIIPWLGTYYTNIRTTNIPTLKSLTDNNLATSSPHAINGFDFIYFNHNGLASFDAAANVRKARDFYIQNGLKISKFVVPHYYELSSEALDEIHSMGVEFIGIHMLPDNFYSADPATLWLNCGPYRLNRNGYAQGERPVYYGGYVSLSGITFFNCLTEIRDDGGYEWFPTSNVTTTVARGIRHLRRSFNSMVLAPLFTHEYYLEPITTDTWREIIRQITSNISEYDPEYRSTDYAVRYIRAKNNIKITNVIENLNDIEIHYSGNNDMDTRCYFFTEQSGQITFHFVELPQVNGNNVVSVIK